MGDMKEYYDDMKEHSKNKKSTNKEQRKRCIMKLIDKIWLKLFGPHEIKVYDDEHIEFKDHQGKVSLEKKQYPYMIDDPRQGIVTDQELINEIEAMAEMPITDIVVLRDPDGIQYNPEDLSLLQIVDKLKSGFTAIPF